MRPLSKPAGTFGISIAARLTRPDAAGVDPGTRGSRGDGALILIFVVDLALATRHGPHVISVGEATRWIVFYVALAVAFGIGLSVVAGGQLGGEFFAGYLTEYSLSIDNLFGAFLIYTAIQLARHRDKPPEIGSNPLVTALERILPTTRQYDGAKVVTRVEGKKVVTPVLLVMIAIGSADLLFALDSIPAVFGLTKEPYIVFTANAFALLGLR